ncbi:MAG: ABC transporter ATP-binding protein [Deltaproteobacteria bacterium]|nr:ABC transporter ATP-binding protein [Deltaproteobacteria bacterium]
MSEILLEARAIRVMRRERVVLDDVSLSLTAHARVAIVGANGSGKSTLLRALLGLDAIAAGEVRLGGTNVRSLSRVEVARRATLVLQDTHVEVPITVRDLVELGRFPHRGTDQARHDRSRVEDAMKRADVSALAERDVRTLSGGELQRAHLARALVQDTRVLLLDEPTSSLDLGHQLSLLAVLRALADDGRAVCVVLHDLALAARWAERIVVLAAGKVVADGSPREVLTSHTLSLAFGVEARVLDVEGQLVVVPA